MTHNYCLCNVVALCSQQTADMTVVSVFFCTVQVEQTTGVGVWVHASVCVCVCMCVLESMEQP